MFVWGFEIEGQIRIDGGRYKYIYGRWRERIIFISLHALISV